MNNVLTMKVFILLLSVFFALPISAASGEKKVETTELKKQLRDIAIGMNVKDLPEGRYKNFRCLYPEKKLQAIYQFGQCPVNNMSLHELWLDYDHSNNKWSETGERYKGTKIAGHPVKLFVFIDDEGVIQGLHAYTDPEASAFTKRQAYLLAVNVKNRYGKTGWECVEKEPGEEGNKPIGPVYIDSTCSKIIDNNKVTVTSKFYRGPNQVGKDFTNLTELEMISLTALSQ